MRLFWVVLFLSCLTARPALADNEAPSPSWRADAQARAEQDGYRIVDTGGVEQALALPGAVYLDVRPGYEFERGHIDGALNLEFDLGDERGISEEKQAAARGLLGPDLSRTVVVGCRGFR